MPVKTPRIAMLAGNPVHGYSFGWAWYTLDQQYRIPVTIRNADSIAGTPIDRFDVLVIPHLFSHEELTKTLGEKGVERLTNWVNDGGSLVALGSGVDVLGEIDEELMELFIDCGITAIQLAAIGLGTSEDEPLVITKYMYRQWEGVLGDLPRTGDQSYEVTLEPLMRRR